MRESHTPTVSLRAGEVPETEVPPELTYATVEKRKRRGRVVEILVHLIFGTMAALAQALGLSRASRRVNVSFLERYHATDRHKGTSFPTPLSPTDGGGNRAAERPRNRRCDVKRQASGPRTRGS